MSDNKNNINLDFTIDEKDLKSTRASGTFEKAFHRSNYFIGIRWSSSRAGNENASNVSATVFIRTTGSGYTISSTATKYVSVTIDGTKSPTGSCTVGIGANSKKDLLTWSKKVGHDSNGNKNCSFSCSLDINVTLSGTYYGKISHSGNGTLDKINLNSAPYWTGDDNTRMNNIKAHAIIPENLNAVTITSRTAWDNEQGSNIHYDLHRYVNGGYSAQIKWGGGELDATDHIGGWGQGTKFKYEAKVHDGHGLWASGGVWSWEYTKNTFTRATVESIGSIGASSTTLSFFVKSARNSGGGNGHVGTDFGYRITSLTSGVNIHGSREHYTSSHSDIGFTLGVKNNGGNPDNPHWLDANELKNVLRGSNYNGNIRLRVESWNAYGSSGSYDFNVWVDLRKNPAWTNIRYTSGWVGHNGSNYYLPSQLPLVATWDHVSDPVGGGQINYDIYYQIRDESWVYLGSSGTSNTYIAYLGNHLNNRHIDRFRLIVRAKTSYGNYSDSGGPEIVVHSYAPPTVTVTSIDRTEGTAGITGAIRINTSVPNIVPHRPHYRYKRADGTWTDNFFFDFNHGGGNPFVVSYTVSGISSNNTYELHTASSDSLREQLVANGVDPGWNSNNSVIPIHTPTLAIRKHGIGINSIPDAGIALSLKGDMHIVADSGYKTTFIKRYTGDVNGMGVAMQTGGKLAIGSGESATTFMASAGGYAGEEAYITSDNGVGIVTNLQQGYSNRRSFNFRSDGNITTHYGNVVVCNSSDGVTELARYIDMRDSTSNNNSPDYDVRLRCFSSGELHISGKLTIGSSRQEVCKLHFANGYYGLESQSNGSEEWIRTPKNGLIPYQSGGYSALGTGGWPFNSICTRQIHSCHTINMTKNGEYSNILFDATAGGNDAGRITHWERNNVSQLWLIPSDDMSSSDEVIVGGLVGGHDWQAAVKMRTDGYIWSRQYGFLHDKFLTRGNWDTNGAQDLKVHNKRALVGMTDGQLFTSYEDFWRVEFKLGGTKNGRQFAFWSAGGGTMEACLLPNANSTCNIGKSDLYVDYIYRRNERMVAYSDTNEKAKATSYMRSMYRDNEFLYNSIKDMKIIGMRSVAIEQKKNKNGEQMFTKDKLPILDYNNTENKKDFKLTLDANTVPFEAAPVSEFDKENNNIDPDNMLATIIGAMQYLIKKIEKLEER